MPDVGGEVGSPHSSDEADPFSSRNRGRWSEGGDKLKSSESRQLIFVFADNPRGGGDNHNADESAGRLFLLYQANAKETIDPDAGADDASCLLERVASLPNLARALLNVARNKGAAGVDGQRVEEVMEIAPELLPRVRQALIDGTYLPGDIRRTNLRSVPGYRNPAAVNAVWEFPTLWTGWFNRRCTSWCSRSLNRLSTTAVMGFVPGVVPGLPSRKQRGTLRTDTGSRWMSTCRNSSISHLDAPFDKPVLRGTLRSWSASV